MPREDQLKAVCFAAGTAAFMACIERATVVSLFAHWRVWAFLALNLLLLAILFTSKCLVPSDQSNQDNAAGSELKAVKKQEVCSPPEQCSPPVLSSESEEKIKVSECEDSLEKETKMEEIGEKEEEAANELSKEELNIRVEAFIAMFRQHLVSDAKSNRRYRMHQLDSPRRASFSHEYRYIRA